MRYLLPVLLVAMTACGGSSSTDTSATIAGTTATTIATTTTTAASTTTTTAPTTTTTAAPTTTTTTAVVYDFPYDFAVVDTIVENGEWDRSWTAVPAVVVGDDGQWYLFYSGDGGRRVPSHLGLATSADGIAWEKVSADGPVFRPPNNLSVGWIGAVQEDDGSWRIWFTGGFSAGHRDIFTASAPSPEGPWEFEDIAFRADSFGTDWNERIVVTGVNKIDGVYWMTYGAFFRGGGAPAIGYATSTDGVTWTSVAEPVLTRADDTWYSEGVSPSLIFQTDRGLELLFIGTDRRWGAGINANVEPFLIGRLVSEDGGATWTLDNGGDPIASTEEKGWPGVATVYEDGTYYVYLGHELGFSGINLITGTIP